MLKRHIWLYALLRPLVALFLHLRFDVRYDKVPPLPESYIVLSNHNTDYDPLLVAIGLKRQMYFVASEHISRWKHAFKFIDFVFAPILRNKGSVATSTVKEILRRVRAGGRVCVFAEGNRSWDGVTCPILPSTGKMIKTARCALVTYKLTGGYFVSPRWGRGLRRGPMRGGVVQVYSAEQVASMSVDEINDIINRDLYEDAYARQNHTPARYRGKCIAEEMESLLALCPVCGKQDTIRSAGDTVSCTACGMQFRYTEYGMLEGAPFSTVKALSDWQKEEIEHLAHQRVVFTADFATLNGIEAHQEALAAQGALTLDADALTCGDMSIPLADITHMALHGRCGLVFSTHERYYELIPAKGNALKFLLLYEAYTHMATSVLTAKE